MDVALVALSGPANVRLVTMLLPLSAIFMAALMIIDGRVLRRLGLGNQST